LIDENNKYCCESTPAENLNLERFIEAQNKIDGFCGDSIYEVALSEMRCGRKVTHWIWFIFPQMKGLGQSYYSNYYGLTYQEALCYSKHTLLSYRLKKCCDELINKEDSCTAIKIFGRNDARKVKSSMTLFWLISGGKIYKDILDKFFDGKLDVRTTDILKSVNSDIINVINL